MADISPTITASNPHTYREQVERILPFAKRVHIDFADGEFAPTKMVSPIQAWMPEGMICDLHVMYQRPEEEIETLISHKPNLVIVHAEAEGNILAIIRELKAVKINAGIALLPNSQPEEFANEIAEASHVLVFGGHLGYHGGVADLKQLAKVNRIKEINSQVELSWDGGVNHENAAQMVAAGIDVLNVGGYIHKADAPDEAYAKLEASIRS